MSTITPFIFIRIFVTLDLDFRPHHFAPDRLSGEKADQEVGFIDSILNPFTPLQTGQDFFVNEYGVMWIERLDDLIND
ncbi:MAG: hypothetical protein L0226_17240 [Acidobacteria bacterium]|nr:hypothetical protein [Acidobacteriota bacterium]